MLYLSLPPKSPGTHRLYEKGPMRGHPFKSTKANSPNLIETEKVKQNEMTEGFVSTERKRENPRKNNCETEINNLSDK